MMLKIIKHTLINLPVRTSFFNFSNEYLLDSKFNKQPGFKSTNLWNAVKLKYNKYRDIPHYTKNYTKKTKIPNENGMGKDFYSLKFNKRKPVINKSEYNVEFH